ncbi:hypothetical protein AAFF_G00374100 [Aldrovandia affinis]|uniref:B30.2/SPRY domain-containing protein n=1 Tax=Aldrovandia affinis TaxID=143900 RepID=A0AAD7R4S7_9TELE|nr:hypothetical protein AAFF_G00374100 [Aldrovandia affinis]
MKSPGVCSALMMVDTLPGTKGTSLTYLPPPPRRVGVFLDWPAGTLSFYSVSSDTLTRLHTFHSTFTEPLYPGFGLVTVGTSVSLCMLGETQM